MNMTQRIRRSQQEIYVICNSMVSNIPQVYPRKSGTGHGNDGNAGNER